MARLGLRVPNRPIIIRGSYQVASSAADATITRSRSVTTDAARSDAGDVTATRTRSVTTAATATDPGRPARPIVVQDLAGAYRARRVTDPVTVIVPPLDVTPATTGDVTSTRVRIVTTDAARTDIGAVTVTRTRSVTTAASSVDPPTLRRQPIVVQDLRGAYLARARRGEPAQVLFAQVDSAPPSTADVAVTRTRSVTTAATSIDPVRPARPLVVSDRGAGFRARLRYDVVTVVVPPVEVGGAPVGSATSTRIRQITTTANAGSPAGASITRTRVVVATITATGVGGQLTTSPRPVPGIRVTPRGLPGLTVSPRATGTLSGGGG